MTETTPVERVAQALENANFRRIPVPLEIAGVTFETAAAFVGKPPSPDLVLVGDSTLQSPQEFQRIIEGVARALDVMRSRRPLSLVLVGPRPDSKVITSLTRYARVLPVGESADASTISNWLAVLLPLHLPQPTDARRLDSLDILRGAADAVGNELIDMALKNPQAIAQRLIETIEEPFVDGGTPEKEFLT